MLPEQQTPTSVVSNNKRRERWFLLFVKQQLARKTERYIGVFILYCSSLKSSLISLLIKYSKLFKQNKQTLLIYFAEKVYNMINNAWDYFAKIFLKWMSVQQKLTISFYPRAAKTRYGQFIQKERYGLETKLKRLSFLCFVILQCLQLKDPLDCSEFLQLVWDCSGWFLRLILTKENDECWYSI